jgi:uncharacterized protein YnzC (UPF0291/DUF896 family)
MLSKEKLERLNELAKKQKTGSLSVGEAQEQNDLRLEYIKAFRGNFESQLQDMGLEKKPKHTNHKGCSCGCGHKH